MAANARMIYNNAADRGTLSVSSVSGLFAAANLKRNEKGDIWRALHTAGVISVLLAASEAVGGMALGFTNLTTAAQVRMRATNEASATNLLNTVTGRCESWGNAPASVRYVTAPDGTPTAVVPTTNEITDRWQFDIPANTHANGTVLTISWHQKTVAHTGTGGQTLTPTSWVGASGFNTVNSIASTNGFTRKWIVMTITDASLTQNIRFYLNGVIGADDIAAWGWQLELGSVMTSYYPNNFTFIGRTLTATYIDANGLVATAAAGVARMQYQYPNLGAVPPQMLIELAGGNYLSQSATFTGWSANGAALRVNNYGVAPDGTQTSTLVETLTFYKAYTAGVGLQTHSVFVKKGTANSIRIHKDGGETVSSIFTFATEQVVPTTLPNLIMDVSVTKLPNGWYRISHTVNSASAAGNFHIYPIGGSAEFWGAMVEIGGLSSYIYTTTSTATRNADTYSTSVGTRPVGYMDWWQSYDADTGFVQALAASPPATLGHGATVVGVNTFAYGGASNGRAWFNTPLNARAVRVEINDPTNPAGYIEVSRLFVGDYLELAVNPDVGMTLGMGDSDVQYRSGGNDLETEVGMRHRELSLRLSDTPEADREKLWRMMCGNGRVVPLYINLYPGANSALEEANQMVCKLTSSSKVATLAGIRYGAPMEFEEI